MFGPLFDVQMSFCVAGTRDSARCQKGAKCEGFVACPKTIASVGHLQRICKDEFHVAGAVQETCSSEILGGQALIFGGSIAFWSITSSGLLRWFCVTGAALRMTWRHFCVAGAALCTDEMEKTKRIGTRPSAVHWTFHFWRQSRRIASFLMLSTSKIEGSLAALLRFWCCHLRKLRKSCRISAFSILQKDRIDRKIDRKTE